MRRAGLPTLYCFIVSSMAASAAMLASLACGRGPLAEKNELAASVWAVLDHADRYELVSVDPTPKSRRRGGKDHPSTAPADVTTKPADMHDFPLLGSATVTDVAQRGQINDALRTSMREWPEMYSGCIFQPRHAIRAQQGATVVEVMICFRCGDAKTFIDGKPAGSAHVNMVTPPIFNDLLTAAHIPLAPE